MQPPSPLYSRERGGERVLPGPHLQKCTLSPALSLSTGRGRWSTLPTEIARRALIVSVATIALSHIHQASAATFTWNGGGADDSWMTAANWGGVAPAGGGTDLLVFDGTVNTSTIDNFPAATSFDGINFASTAGTFTLGGNSLTLTGDIFDGSANTQSINLPITLAAARNIDVAAGGTLAIGGAISGTALGITKTDLGTLTLTGSNVFTGPTTINGGTLKLDYSAPGALATILSPSSRIVFGNGGLLSSTLLANGAAAGSNQTLGGVTFNSGAAAIAASGSITLNLGTISPTVEASSTSPRRPPARSPRRRPTPTSAADSKQFLADMRSTAAPGLSAARARWPAQSRA